MGSVGEELKKAYEERYRFFLKRTEQRNTLRTLDDEIALLRCCLKNIKSEQSPFPIMAGNSASRVSVTCLGTLPPYRYDSRTIVPVGFSSKKRFKAHREYKKTARDKILYVCSVEGDGPRIVADDGSVWSGEHCWDGFVSSFDDAVNFGSFEEFAGLTHPSITKLIEELGDVSQYDGYVPLEQRDDKPAATK